MSEESHCANCVFWLRGRPLVRKRWFRSQVTETNQWGLCCRYPRKFVVSTFKFPDAHEDDWCGEWDDWASDDDEKEKTDEPVTSTVLSIVGRAA